jgi:hypothetical protein
MVEMNNVWAGPEVAVALILANCTGPMICPLSCTCLQELAALAALAAIVPTAGLVGLAETPLFLPAIIRTRLRPVI